MIDFLTIYPNLNSDFVVYNLNRSNCIFILCSFKIRAVFNPCLCGRDFVTEDARHLGNMGCLNLADV